MSLGPKLPYFGAFRLEFEKTIAMFKIDTLKFTKMLKVMLNKKNPKFGTKIALLVCFWTGIKQTIVIFEINTFEFAKLELLIKKVNFGIELVFFEGPGSTFSECPGPGMLCKVCSSKDSLCSKHFRTQSIYNK